MKININGVSITLTKEQLKEIDKQTKNTKTIDDIIDYQSACAILDRIPYKEGAFIKDSDWYNEQLMTIIEAANYLDNDNHPWDASKAFLDTNLAKYLPWLERKASGWVVGGVGGYCSGFGVPVEFYYKSKESANILVKRFLPLYNKAWG